MGSILSLGISPQSPSSPDPLASPNIVPPTNSSPSLSIAFPSLRSPTTPRLALTTSPTIALPPEVFCEVLEYISHIPTFFSIRMVSPSILHYIDAILPDCTSHLTFNARDLSLLENSRASYVRRLELSRRSVLTVPIEDRDRLGTTAYYCLRELFPNVQSIAMNEISIADTMLCESLEGVEAEELRIVGLRYFTNNALSDLLLNRIPQLQSLVLWSSQERFNLNPNVMSAGTNLRKFVFRGKIAWEPDSELLMPQLEVLSLIGCTPGGSANRFRRRGASRLTVPTHTHPFPIAAFRSLPKLKTLILDRCEGVLPEAFVELSRTVTKLHVLRCVGIEFDEERMVEMIGGVEWIADYRFVAVWD